MYFESELSAGSSDEKTHGKHKNYTKVMLKATEEEKSRMREMLSKQKK